MPLASSEASATCYLELWDTESMNQLVMCKYVYRYIECITDRSNWSGSFSLVVVCSIYNLGFVSLNLSWGA